MLGPRPISTAFLTTLLCAVSQTPASAQSEKPQPKAKPPAAATGPNLPDCSKFQDWSFGQQCRRKDGKTCQVMGQRADPSELKYCK